MPVISLRLSQEQYAQLQKKANQKNIPVYAFIMDKLFPSSASSGQLTIERVIKKLDSVQSGTEFTIESLFTPEEWKNFSGKETVGRIFRQQSKIADSCVEQNAVFIEKISGKPALYRKK